MRLRSVLLLFLLFIFVWKAQSQTTPVTIRVTTQQQHPLPYATISLTLLSDSAQVNIKNTDSSGKAEFLLHNEQGYMLEISSIGFAVYKSIIQASSNNLSFTYSLQPDTKALTGVVVTATRPMVRQEDDKTIIDPEPLAPASTNAYEILEKTPGIFADQDGNIFLSSTTPAIIYINGREQKMSAADIATMLKSLPPGSIASIELLRTPSARYDASGGGGIVNIILKKGVRIGLTGSINTGMSQGRYGNQFAGINLNNSNGRWNSFINIQLSQRNNYEKLQTDRFLATDTFLRQHAFTTLPSTSVYTGYGINYSPSKSWEIGYDGRITLNGSDNRSGNRSVMQSTGSGQIVSENFTSVATKSRGITLVQGLSAKHKWDSAGSEWTTDISHSLLPSILEQDFDTRFYKPTRTPHAGTGTQDRDVHQLQAQTNIVLKLSEKIKLETGLKTTNVWFSNLSAYYNIYGTQSTPDMLRTNRFSYNENIHAAYLQGSRNFSGIVLKAGARLENTQMKGTQKVPYDTTFHINRTDLFPYVYLSRKVMQIAGYDLKAYLVYRRTITRPAYDYLNPAPRFIDPYLFEAGNPGLRPQFNKNYEANISVDERPIIAIGWNDTRDIFSQVVYQADTSKAVTYRTYDNLGANKEFYFRALGAIPPGKRYFFVAGVQYNHNRYNGVYESKPLTFDRGSWTVFTYQSLKIDKQTQVSLNGFARFKGQLQFYELTSFGALNLSLNRQFLQKKLNLGISVSDAFFTNNNRFTLNQGSINALGYREGDTRRLGISLRYSFGIRKKEENNFMNIESPEKGGQGN